MTQRPNLIIFNPDQWRGDVLGHLGHPAVLTPNLDRIVGRDAVSFSQTYCQNPICSPSRCSFMTGWYPHVHGHRSQHYLLQDHEPNSLKLLKEDGYHVWWGGKNDLVGGQGKDPLRWAPHCDVKDQPRAVRKWMHHSDVYNPPRGEPGSDTYYSFFVGKLDPADPRTRFDYPGIDDIDEQGVYRDQDWGHVLNAIEFIRSHPPEPWCIFLALGNPHPPYAVEEPYFSAIDRSAVPGRVPVPESWNGKPAILEGLYELSGMSGWSEDRWRELQAVYYGQCMRVDDQFGRVVSALEEVGAYDGTALFFFADHGDYAGDYGLVQKNWNTFEDCLTRVPFIVKPPKGVDLKPGMREQPVELVDFFATACDMAGIEPAHTHFGRSVRPLLANPAAEHRDAVFCEGGRMECEARHVDGPGPPGNRAGLYWVSQHLGQRMPEAGKAFMCRTPTHKYVMRLYEQDELYDLENDPRELHNRIEDPALGEIRAELRDRLLRHLAETTDVVSCHRDGRGN